jgi:membrane protein DedA with SNARE-associated domain
MVELLGGWVDAVDGMIGSPWLWVVVFAVAGLDALLPFMPSETTVVIVGVLVAPDPALLALLILVAATGAWAGDCLAYAIGRRCGRRVIARWTRTDKGRRRHASARRLLARHGTMLIIAGRYVAGIRSVTMLTAGMLRYPTRRFLGTAAAGVALWAGYAALIGYIGGAAFEHNPINGMLLAFGIGLVLAGLIEGARRIAARRRPDPTPPRPAPLPALAGVG